MRLERRLTECLVQALPFVSEVGGPVQGSVGGMEGLGQKTQAHQG